MIELGVPRTSPAAATRCDAQEPALLVPEPEVGPGGGGRVLRPRAGAGAERWATDLLGRRVPAPRTAPDLAV